MQKVYKLLLLPTKFMGKRGTTLGKISNSSSKFLNNRPDKLEVIRNPTDPLYNVRIIDLCR